MTSRGKRAKSGKLIGLEREESWFLKRGYEKDLAHRGDRRGEGQLGLRGWDNCDPHTEADVRGGEPSTSPKVSTPGETTTVQYSSVTIGTRFREKNTKGSRWN